MKFSPGEIAILWHPDVGVCGDDYSFLHGTEVLVVGFTNTLHYDYEIEIPGFDDTAFVKESELRKKNQDGEQDKELTCSWDDCVWSPHKQKETTE